MNLLLSLVFSIDESRWKPVMGRVGKHLCQHGGIGNENFWFESKEKGSGRRKKRLSSTILHATKKWNYHVHIFSLTVSSHVLNVFDIKKP